MRPTRSELQGFRQLVGMEAERHVELAELAVDGAAGVEAHFVDDVAHALQVAGEERYAPFPVVDAGRAGDELKDAAGEAAAGVGVAAHELLPFLEGQREPVAPGLARLAHRIEADD